MHHANATSTPNNNNNNQSEALRKDGTKPSTVNSSATSTPEHRRGESPSRSSRRDSLTDKPTLPCPPPPAAAPPAPPHPPHPLHPGPSISPASETSYDSGNNLLQEYQRAKMRFQQEAAREAGLQRDNRLVEER